ncbi:MAG: spore germination protein [Clostridia bacterium]|nr:spore germination protein [Clostridia bacterium]
MKPENTKNPPDRPKDRNTDIISPSAHTNKQLLLQLFGNSFDLMFREINCGEIQYTAAFLDGMCDRLFLSQSVIRPLSQPLDCKKEDAIDVLYDILYEGIERAMVSTMSEVIQHLIAGSLVFFADECTTCVCFNAPIFARRAVTEPTTEQQEKGSHEGFTDFFKDNVTLLRRRLRTEQLHIEKQTLGSLSNTLVCICYLADRTDEKLLHEVRSNLSETDLDIILGAGSLRPFLDSRKEAFFSSVGTTERPDTLAAKLTEGRIGIIVDGVPFALFIPQLLIDHFHSPDDYLTKPYYAFLLRCLRIAAFFCSTILPGLFVAVCTYHPEILPTDIMFDIAVAISQTPFPLGAEALIIIFIYEIVREAGLRMPKAVGHAVSIVGALVIGDAAVTAGLIAAPMLIVVALTAISSAALSGIHAPMAALRFLFILAGSTLGLFGIAVLATAVSIGICGMQPYTIPFSSGISPYKRGAMRDLLVLKKRHKTSDLQMKDLHF